MQPQHIMQGYIPAERPPGYGRGPHGLVVFPLGSFYLSTDFVGKKLNFHYLYSDIPATLQEGNGAHVAAGVGAGGAAALGHGGAGAAPEGRVRAVKLVVHEGVEAVGVHRHIVLHSGRWTLKERLSQRSNHARVDQAVGLLHAVQPYGH